MTKRAVAAFPRRRTRQAHLTNWADLRPEEPVEIVKNAQIVAIGLVEEVSASGTVLWIRGDSGEHHQPFLKSDGIFVRRALEKNVLR